MQIKSNNIKKSHKGIFTALWILILLSYAVYSNYSMNTIIIAIDLPLSHTIEISDIGSTTKYEFDSSAFFGDYENDPETLLNYNLKSLGLKNKDFTELYTLTFYTALTAKNNITAYKDKSKELKAVVCIFPSEKIDHVDFTSIVPSVNQFHPYDDSHYVMLKIHGKYFALTKQQVENFILMEEYIGS